MRKKITSEDIKEAMKNFSGKYTHLGTAKAEGATLDGSVCAARAGSSLMGRAQQRANYLRDNKKELKKRKAKLKKTKPKKKLPATERQRNYMKVLGINFKPWISKFDAMNLISQVLRETKKLNKEIQKRIDLDE
jgi:hypothetical protein